MMVLFAYLHSFHCVFQIFCHKISWIACGVLSLSETPCKRRQIDPELDQKWEKIDIIEEDHLNTAEVYSCLHGNWSKLQAVASKLQLVESCSVLQVIFFRKILLLSAQLFARACPGLPGRVGRFHCVHSQQDTSLGANHAHPSSHCRSSTNTTEVGVRPRWFWWTRAHLCPSWAQTCVLLCTYVAGRLYSKELCYFMRKRANSHGGVCLKSVNSLLFIEFWWIPWDCGKLLVY